MANLLKSILKLKLLAFTVRKKTVLTNLIATLKTLKKLALSQLIKVSKWLAWLKLANYSKVVRSLDFLSASLSQFFPLQVTSNLQPVLVHFLFGYLKAQRNLFRDVMCFPVSQITLGSGAGSYRRFSAH